jgi:ACS family hexuronate transporter-like MFS transporter
MIFWSLACASHGLASSVVMLVACRLMLGVGEGGGFPAATRAVAEWFDVRERSSAMGIINAGTALGGVAAPPLIALILSHLHWRWVFFLTGALGALWTVTWGKFYFVPQNAAESGELRPAAPSQHAPQGSFINLVAADVRRLILPRPTEVRASFRRLLHNGKKPSVSAASAVPWFDLLRFRELWGVVLAKFLSDAAWYFYLFWLPKYLYDARGLDIKAVGAFAWVPYAAAGAGCLCGGWLSSHLLGRKASVNRARKTALGWSAEVMPFILFVPHVSLPMAIALFSLAYFGQQSWSTLVMVLPTDLFPKSTVGAVAGLVGFGGAMGGVAFGQLVGYLLDHGAGYGVVFGLAASFHVIAFIVICLAIPIIRPVSLAQEPGAEESER